MLLFDYAREVARLDPVEHVDLAGILRRDDARKHILRLFGAERPGHHRFDLRARVETDRGPLARLGDEIVEHGLDLVLAHIADREHRAAELADLDRKSTRLNSSH